MLEVKKKKQKNSITGVPGYLSHLCLTLGLGLGHHLMVHDFEPHIGLSAMQSLLGVLSPSLSVPSPLTLYLFQK